MPIVKIENGSVKVYEGSSLKGYVSASNPTDVDASDEVIAVIDGGTVKLFDAHSLSLRGYVSASNPRSVQVTGGEIVVDDGGTTKRFDSRGSLLGYV